MQSTISEKQVTDAPTAEALEFSALQQAKRILATGDTTGARAFVERALLETPDDEGLQKFARLIAPQQVRVVPSSPAMAAKIAANRQWLLENAGNYQGQWVVLKGGELVGHGEDLNEIGERIGSMKGMFIKRIF